MSKALEYLQRLDEEFQASAEGYGSQLRLDFAEILWRALKRLGWSQTEFAERSGWPDSFVSNLVHGNQNCELDTLGKAFHTLGVTVQLRLVQESCFGQFRYLEQATTLSPITTGGRQHGKKSHEENTLRFRAAQTEAPGEDVFGARGQSRGCPTSDVTRRQIAMG